MTATPNRQLMLDLIRKNISRHGYHVNIVAGGTIPRFAYTVGLKDRDGLVAELVFAGGLFYSADEVKKILHSAQSNITSAHSRNAGLAVEQLGEFTLREVHPTWSALLLLAALDYYEKDAIQAYQVVPDPEHHTVDVPNLRQQWSADREPAWQWLNQPWTYPVPSGSTATTNLNALRGHPITEATRWGEDEWEVFAGPGPAVTRPEMRVAPLGTLLAIDPTLSPVVDLPIGRGLWRQSRDDDWSPWGPSHSSD